MKYKFNDNLLEILKLTDSMQQLAKKGITESNDDGCVALYGLLMDTMYKIKTEAENEINKHKRLDKWFFNFLICYINRLLKPLY